MQTTYRTYKEIERDLNSLLKDLDLTKIPNFRKLSDDEKRFISTTYMGLIKKEIGILKNASRDCYKSIQTGSQLAEGLIAGQSRIVNQGISTIRGLYRDGEIYIRNSI